MEIKLFIKKYLALLALYSIPLTGSFLITEKISISLILFSVIIIIDAEWNKQILIAIMLLISLMLLSLFFNKIDFRSLLYTYSFVFSIFVYSLGSQSIVKSIGLEALFKVSRRLLTITSFVLILEFLFSNFNIGLEVVLPRRFDNIDNYNPTMMGIFNRSRGFARESAHMGLLYEMLVPMLLFLGSKKMKFIEITLWMVAALSLGSPVTIGLLFVTLLLRINSKSFLLYAIGLIYFLINPEFVKSYFIKIISSSPSSIDRLNRIKIGLDSIEDNFFGVGPLNLNGYDSTLNLYLDIFVFYGIPVGLVFMLFLILIAAKSFKNNLVGLNLSFLLLLAHYLIISNFWYPFIWIISGLILLPKRYVVH